MYLVPCLPLVCPAVLGRRGSFMEGQGAMAISWDQYCAGSARRVRGSAIRDMLAITAQPDVISFAGGLPAPELFPVAALRESYDRVLRDSGPEVLQYGSTEGHLPLRRLLADRLSARGMAARPEEILITTGSQQGLLLLGLVLLDRGDWVMVESPSYVGALQAFNLHEPRYLPVPMDEEGMLVHEARRRLAEAGGARFLYTVATFQNPSGVTLSASRRLGLLDVSREFGLPLIEDDPYGDLRYEGESVPSFRALPGGQDTAYLGTFSKTLAPGLRLGYVLAPEALISRLVMAKQAADLHTDTLTQYAVLDFLRHNDLDAHVTMLRDVYRTRRDAMLAALESELPPGCTWTRPAGGLFTWVTLPPYAVAADLLRLAVQRKVAFVPGDAFFTDGSGANTLRLNFSHASPERIDEGMSRLGSLLREQLREAAPRSLAGAEAG
jgi:2-aminoadipate transaminase